MFANRCVNTAAFDVPASSRTQLQSLQGQIEMKFPAQCCSLGNFWWRRPVSTGVWGQSFMQHHSVLIELWTEVSWKSMQYERHLTACENEVSIDDTVALLRKGILGTLVTLTECQGLGAMTTRSLRHGKSVIAFIQHARVYSANGTTSTF